MKLDERLNAVLSYIELDDTVCDIGADHGYLSIAMLEKGVSLVQVVENKIGPLNNAKKNLKQFNNVLFSLSDGIEKIDKRIDTCVICGMGGYTIIDILKAHLEQAKSFKKIILQPNSHIEVVRAFLNDYKFKIVDEDLIEIDKHFYHIIVLNNEELENSYSDNEILFGPILLKKQPISLIHKYQAVVDCYKMVLKSEISENERERITKDIALIIDNIDGVKYES